MTNPYMVKIGNPTTATSGSFAGSYPSQQLTDIINLGVGTVFYQVRWDYIDVSNNTSQDKTQYVWTSWDNAISQCNQAGIDIIIAVLFPPTQLQKVIGGSASGVAQTSYLTTFCQQIAHAYTAGDPQQRGTRHIAGIYVGNEDYDHGGSGGLPAEAVLAMKAVYGPIKAINSNMLVIAPAKLQRNLAFYNSWFGTLLNNSTGAWIGGVFQADALSFHYHSAQPWDNTGTPLAPDPSKDVVSGGQTIPSWRTAWKTIQSIMKSNGLNLPVYADENGESVNINPGRPANSVISDSTRSGYINYELEEARNSGVVTHYGIFTLAEFVYTSGDVGQRDGQSLIQGSTSAPVYGATWQMMQQYIQNHPTWSPSSVKNLNLEVASKFVTQKSRLATKTHNKFYTRVRLTTKTKDNFLIGSAFRLLFTLARSKFVTKKQDPDYAHATLPAVDGKDTFTTATDGTITFTGIG